MAGPLCGIRIVEMTSVVLGPWAGQLLADMGADVVKVETPQGDSNRHVGAARHPGMAALYLTCNRNKRSNVLDLKKPGARDALLRLVTRADVFLHNNRPAVMQKFAIEYADLKAVNERLVYCGAHGYGRRGRYGARGALDDSIQSIAGVAALNAQVMGEPRYLPTIIADKTTAITVVYAVLAALLHRERTGEGQEIEVPMFETMVNFLMTEHLWGQTFEPPTGPAGYVRLMSRHRRPYRTLDGYIAILPYLDTHWQTFCRESGRHDLLDDPRFATLAARTRNIDATYEETARTMATRSTQEWLDLFENTNVPVNRVSSLDDLIDDPHLSDVGFWQQADHPTEGSLRMTAFPALFSATPAENRLPAPRLGEHSAELLHEAGLTDPEIDALVAVGATVIADGWAGRLTSPSHRGDDRVIDPERIHGDCARDSSEQGGRDES
jgi:crotonobetainyl-CoA:carnitine CoA-transferase CaiB-like acyl-CoA transferase